MARTRFASNFELGRYEVLGYMLLVAGMIGYE